LKSGFSLMHVGGIYNTWLADPMFKIVTEFEASLKRYPPIKLGTPDPYTPPPAAGSRAMQ
jgi:hypothetical protein